jgi:hypothetical protein
MPRTEENKAALIATQFDEHRELEGLMTVAAQWGLESGFLGIEGHPEARMTALLEEASRRLFGDPSAERVRLMAEIEPAQNDWNQAQQVISGYRSRYGSQAHGERIGLVRRLRHWLWNSRDYRSAVRVIRRRTPQLRDLRTKLDVVEATHRAAGAWRETAAPALKATFEYQNQRAGIARARKEENDNDDPNAKYLVASRAN